VSGEFCVITKCQLKYGREVGRSDCADDVVLQVARAPASQAPAPFAEEPLLAASAILDERPTPIRVAGQAEVGVGAATAILPCSTSATTTGEGW